MTRRYLGRACAPPPPRPTQYSGSHRPRPTVESPTFRRRKPLRRPRLPLWQELPLLVILAFSLALLVRTFLMQSFFIPSGSMENTLHIRDRVLVNKVVYKFRDPRRGEVIVFRGEDSWVPENQLDRTSGLVTNTVRTVGSLFGFVEPAEKDFIKRVIGVPGDRVGCCDKAGRVTVNGVSLTEPYVFDNNPSVERAFGPITVPAGRLFVMGDHRGRSKDSRAYVGDEWRGTIAIDNVLGRAFVRMWPISHWGSLSTPPTFTHVPTRPSRGPPSTPQNALMGGMFVIVGRQSLVISRFGGNRCSKWVCRPQ